MAKVSQNWASLLILEVWVHNDAKSLRGKRDGESVQVSGGRGKGIQKN